MINHSRKNSSVFPIPDFGFGFVMAYRPSKKFSVMLGQTHRFLGITSAFWGVMVSLLKDTTRRR